MKVFVDISESGPLTQEQWKQARRLFPGQPASGRVMNLDQACRAQRQTGMVWGMGFLIACWILAVFFALVGKSDGAIGNFIGGVIVWLAIYLGFCVSAWRGRAGFAERYAGLPEPGTLVKADEAGLTIGERAAAWPDISLAATRFKKDVDGDYILERVTLGRAFEGVDLDLDLIEKGRSVVGYAFLRLCPEPPAEGA